MTTTTNTIVFLLLAALLPSLASAAKKKYTPPTASNFPKNFRAELKTTSFKLAIGMTWIDDDRALILEKSGKIYICEPNRPGFPKELYMEIPEVYMYKVDETGALSLEIDPDFHATENAQPFVYVYYGSVRRGKEKSAMRLSKFRHVENSGGLTSRASWGSEKLLWHDSDGWGVFPQWHYGGSIQFGPDKRVYLTLGDKYTERFQRSAKHNSGCIIRVNRDGSIPKGNLNTNVKPAACWAHGIRNGFSSHWDLETERYLIAEVGGNDKCTSMEDIHLGKAGADYGWPYCEGHCDNPDYPQCNCKKHDDPIWTYEHKDCDGAAIIGGTVVRNTAWPEEHQGAYFYGDFVTGELSFLTFEDGQTDKVKSSTKFGHIDDPIVMVKDNRGNLWVTTYQGRRSGVFKISYTGANQAPAFNLALASKTTGNIPLTVSFASHARDYEGQPLSYNWHFGDGTSAETQNAVHTFTKAGIYTVQVYASDGKLSTGSEEIVVTAGAIPTPTILSPSTAMTFQAGETIQLVGKGAYSTANGGQRQLSEANLQWYFGFIHDDHVHPIGSDPIGATASYTVPKTGHTYEAGTGLKFELVATSPDGITAVTSIEMLPELTTQQFISNPSGIKLVVDHKEYTTPFEISSIVGFQHELRVSPICHNNMIQGNNARIEGPYNASSGLVAIPAVAQPVIVTLDNDGSTSGTWCPSPPVEVCTTANEYQVATIDCGSHGTGYTVSSVNFASYGLPEQGVTNTNGCSDAKTGRCHSSVSTKVLEKECLGRATCNIAVMSATFGGECMVGQSTLDDFVKVGTGYCRGESGISVLVGAHKVASLDQCKLECLGTAGCTGIEYTAKDTCKLHKESVSSVKKKSKVQCFSMNVDMAVRSLVANVVCEQQPPPTTTSSTLTVTSTTSSVTSATTTTTTRTTTTTTTTTTTGTETSTTASTTTGTDTTTTGTDTTTTGTDTSTTVSTTTGTDTSTTASTTTVTGTSTTNTETSTSTTGTETSVSTTTLSTSTTSRISSVEAFSGDGTTSPVHSSGIDSDSGSGSGEDDVVAPTDAPTVVSLASRICSLRALMGGFVPHARR